MKDLFHSLEKSGISDPKSVSEQWSPVRDEERTRVMSFISAYTCDFGGEEKEGNPYCVLNGEMHFFQEQKTKLMNVCWFLYGVLEGLCSLPHMQYSFLYRGVDTVIEWK